MFFIYFHVVSLASTVLEKLRIKYKCGRYRMKKRVLQHLLTPQLMIVELPADQELLELASVRCTVIKMFEIY